VARYNNKEKIMREYYEGYMAKDASINPFGRRFWDNLYNRMYGHPGAVQTPKKDPTKAGQAGRNIADRGKMIRGL